MELADIKKVEDLKSTSDVNEYISLGWRLLLTYTTAYDVYPPMAYHQTAHYVVGWPGDNPVYPEQPGLAELLGYTYEDESH